MGLFDKLEKKNYDVDDSYFQYVEKLPKDIELEILRMVSLTPLVFNITDSNGKDIVTQINDIVDNILTTNIFPKIYTDIEDVAVALGIYYGQIICNYYNWSWGYLGKNEESAQVSIVSPNKNYSIQPMNYMLKILTKKNIGLDGNNDNTVLLLFNMLKDIDNNKAEKLYTPLS